MSSLAHKGDLSVYSRSVAGKEDHAAQNQRHDLRTEERKEDVGAIILSMISICRQNGTNVWIWMVSVLKRESEVSGNPAAFLPWVYKGEAEKEEERAA
jgi:hypothetical protein